MSNSWKQYYVTNDQVLALLKLFKETKNIKIKDILVKRLNYLVQSKIKGYKKQNFYSDLLQEGRIGLLRAIDKFDIKRGKNFFKYAEWCILDQIKVYLRCHHRVQKAVVAANKNNHFNSKYVDPQEYIDTAEEMLVLQNALNRLPEIDRNVLIMRFGMFGTDCYTFRQIGEMYSLSKQRVEQIQKRAIGRLKNSKDIRVLLHRR